MMQNVTAAGRDGTYGQYFDCDACEPAIAPMFVNQEVDRIRFCVGSAERAVENESHSVEHVW